MVREPEYLWDIRTGIREVSRPRQPPDAAVAARQREERRRQSGDEQLSGREDDEHRPAPASAEDRAERGQVLRDQRDVRTGEPAEIRRAELRPPEVRRRPLLRVQLFR